MSASAALATLDAVGIRLFLLDDGTVRLVGSGPPPPEVLALARAHRDGIEALLRNAAAAMPNTQPSPVLPGVSQAWRDGVSLLATMPTPNGITPARWATFASTSRRLLHDHGAVLHEAGWTTLDLFGLHCHAPATNPPGWGLAWLLGIAGAVLDVSPMVVGLRRGPGGARMTFRRRGEKARAGIIPAWIIERTGP